MGAVLGYSCFVNCLRGLKGGNQMRGVILLLMWKVGVNVDSSRSLEITMTEKEGMISST